MRSQAPLVTLRPMTEAEYSPWRPHSLATYAAERAQVQGRSVEEVLPEVTRQNEGFLKDGLGTEGHDLLRVIVADEPVGWLWLGPHPEKPGAAWVYEIEMDERARGVASGAPPCSRPRRSLRRVACVSSGSMCSGTTSGPSTCTDRSATRRRR